jgi:hypothetical protein
MALIDDVKTALRISHTKLDADITTKLDADITETIDAGKKDLSIAGVAVVDDADALIEQAIKMYCRYVYNYQGQSERWERAYIALKQALALCSDYNTEATTP